MRHLLLITADQLRYDYIGAMGKQPVDTPNLDELYRNGARHTAAYSVSPLCMPARCSLLTGLYTHQHGINENRGDLSPFISTLPHALQTLGYRTAMIGKIHFYEGIPSALDYTLCRGEVARLGFDHVWLTSGKSMSEFCMDDWTYALQRKGLLERYRSDVAERNRKASTEPTFLKEEDTVDYATAEEAVRYLDGYDGKKPFFMWLSFCNPHFPFDALEGLQDKYLTRDFPRPAGFDGDDEKYKRHAASYAALVEQLDGYIGRVVRRLKDKGLYEDTVIVFTADHGEMLCDHGQMGKTPFYDGSARVPFMALNAGLIQPQECPQAVEITDVAATFLELAGAGDIQKYLPESPSQSLLKVWRGDRVKRGYAFFESGYQFSEPYKALCDGQWKYVIYSFTGEELLIDMQNDKEELHDVSAQNRQKVAEMRHAMLKRLCATPSPIPKFWIHEKITGKASEEWHHGPITPNTGLENLE